MANQTKNHADLIKAQGFLEAVPDTMIVVDRSGVIQFATPQSLYLLGYTPDEINGKNIDMLVPSAYRETHHKHRANFIAKGKNRLMGYGDVLYAQHKMGQQIPVEISLKPINTEDGIVIAASLRDVTSRIESEQKIKEALNLAESATKEKSRFLAAASHDLRQPLQSLTLYLSALKTITKDSPKAFEIGQKMSASLDGMKDLLDVLLDISKLDGGLIQPEISDFSLNAIVDTVLNDFQPLAQQKQLILKPDISDDIYISSDQALLTRIIENFVSNAIRYTDSGNIEIRANQTDANIKISVSDTGIGIPSEALELVFEEYYQLGNAHRDQRKGLGLGLSVVKRIADILDHQLEATSNPGDGSTFSVYVPIAECTALNTQSISPPININSSEATILCIEDNEAVLDSLTMFLELSGYTLFTAQDGAAAWSHIDAGVRPDIILSDYRLPGQNGIEIVKIIRQALSIELPVIMMTGDTSGTLIRQAGLENLEILSKPVNVDQLLSLISKMTLKSHDID